MRIVSIGGGPAGVYFAILMKLRDPRHAITVLERNRRDDTFGFGVVFSDATLEQLAQADPQTFAALERRFHHWDDIEIHCRGHRLSSTGHGFSGLARSTLLEVLYARAEGLGVDLRFEAEAAPADAPDADLIVAADGANSPTRDRLADHFAPSLDVRPNRYVWLGTTCPFPAFTFYFKESAHGLWRVHAYQFDGGQSTFIVEATPDTWCAAGLAEDDEEATRAFCEDLFAEELDGHPLLTNRSLWRQFVTVRNARWHHGNIVLLGDAAHTAHFSVGSGTKLAMEDAIALADALEVGPDLGRALAAYETERRPEVESLQRAAQVSLQWFEDTERYVDLPSIQFGFTLLTRSFRITHQDLAARDPDYVARVNDWFAERAAEQSGRDVARRRAPPPMFTPFRLRDLVLENRVVVSPMCQYCAEDGTPNDWHLQHLGSRAIGGAGLVFTEMTDVSADARITPGCTGMYKPEHVDAWKRIVDFVHHWSNTKIGMQLGHAGRKGATAVPWKEGMDEPLPDGAWPILSASSIPYFPHSQVPREMTRRDMDLVRDDFVRAAEMADFAGFDILEIHFAHGYLLASFVSPLTNTRTDEYGGAVDDRLRFPLEVFRAVREAWPDHKPVSVRISAVDWAPGGMEAEDAVEVGKLLAAAGVDIVDVSAGQTVADQKPVYGRQFQTPFSDRIRLETGLPTMAVGNISSYMDVNTILAAGRADLCVLARAHLWDPYWTRHAAHLQGYELPWPPQYMSLNRYTPRFE